MGQGDPLHLQPDPEPELEQVRLGNDTIEVDPQTAATIRQSYETLAAQYGAQLEELRRQALQSIGTPYAPSAAQPAMPMVPDGLAVPDPDLLFQNKQQWAHGLAQSVEDRIGGVRAEAAQIAQGTLQAVQQELNRRDAMAQARAVHDKAMEEMLERRGLSEHTRIVQAIYNEQYGKLQHLPLELALDQIGKLANEEIDRIRAGEKWTVTPAQTQTGTTQRAPAMLRSARRASPRPAPVQAPEMTLESTDSLGAMGRIIRKNQALRMGTSTA